jgi:hypothetical protein
MRTNFALVVPKSFDQTILSKKTTNSQKNRAFVVNICSQITNLTIV